LTTFPHLLRDVRENCEAHHETDGQLSGGVDRLGQRAGIAVLTPNGSREIPGESQTGTALRTGIIQLRNATK
jgi:hypothetical protein